MIMILLISLIIMGTGCTPTRQLAKRQSSPVLSQQQAYALARRLAAEKYGVMFGDAAFQNSSPPVLISGRWTWFCSRGSGHCDIVVRVIFDPDGGLPIVEYQCLSSAMPSPASMLISGSRER